MDKLGAEMRELLLSNSLEHDCVCVVLAGFLAQEITHTYGVADVDAARLARVIMAYRTHVSAFMDAAITLYDAGFRAPSERN